MRNSYVHIFLLATVLTTTALSQTRIHEKVDLTKQMLDSVQVSQHLSSGTFGNAVGSGFVIPRSSGLRTRLEIYYSQLERLDEAIPFWARLLTLKRDTTLSDTVYSRFPSLQINPETFQDVCGTWGTQHNKYLYFPTAATELYKAGKISPGDTIRFGYITERVSEHVRDTLGIYSCDTVRLAGDTTIVGWNVAFADYNNCLNTWNDKLDVFVGMNCTEYGPPFYRQYSNPWAGDHYLWAYKYQYHPIKKDSVIGRTQVSIQTLGCALTSLANFLGANGVNTDPRALNNYMKFDTTFIDWARDKDSASVRWEAPNHMPDSPAKLLRAFGKGIRRNKPLPPPLRVDTLNYFLNRCYGVIVHVANPPDSSKPHWVLVQGKDVNGRYLIIDPGDATRTSLDAYRNTIYKVVVYRRKENS